MCEREGGGGGGGGVKLALFHYVWRVIVSV